MADLTNKNSILQDTKGSLFSFVKRINAFYQSILIDRLPEEIKEKISDKDVSEQINNLTCMFMFIDTLTDNDQEMMRRAIELIKKRETMALDRNFFKALFGNSAEQTLHHANIDKMNNFEAQLFVFQNKGLKQKTSELEAGQVNMQKQIGELQGAVKKLQEENIEIRLEIESTNVEIDRLKKKVKSLEKENLRLQQQMLDLTQGQSNHEETVQQIIDNLKKENAEKQKRLMKQIETLTAKLESLKSSSTTSSCDLSTPERMMLNIFPSIPSSSQIGAAAPSPSMTTPDRILTARLGALMTGDDNDAKSPTTPLKANKQ